jgi:replication-associated recombination protein RarA
MSLMQKAIRRGRKDLALQAAATLLDGSPERLWRRLGCTAFEDIGIGNLDTVAIVTDSRPC